ncbi:MAG: CaiB/BaiF CoA transferase family protein [Myxococcota bacterium]
MAEDAPLAGVRVLDLSRLFPGPYCTLLLADLGAEVVCVDDVRGGDFLRFLPPLAPDGQGAVFHALRRGKRSVALDLRSAEGKDTLTALIGVADVLVEGFRPGVLERLGFDPHQLVDAHPGLVVCRISGYGQTGPLRLRAGHDLNYVARAGVLGMMATPDVLPMQVADLAGGSWPAALQIVSALWRRQATGKGAVIDVNMAAGARATLVMPLARRAMSRESIGGGRDLLAGAVPAYGVYPTRDGHLAVAALEPRFFLGFLDVIGLPELKDSGLSTGHEAERVRTQIAERLRTKTTAEWVGLFDGRDVCVEPIVSPDNDDEGRAHDIGPTPVEVTIGGEVLTLPGTPLDLAATNARPASLLGAENEEVLAAWGVQPGTAKDGIGRRP